MNHHDAFSTINDGGFAARTRFVDSTPALCLVFTSEASGEWIARLGIDDSAVRIWIEALTAARTTWRTRLATPERKKEEADMVDDESGGVARDEGTRDGNTELEAILLAMVADGTAVMRGPRDYFIMKDLVIPSEARGNRSGGTVGLRQDPDLIADAFDQLPTEARPTTTLRFEAGTGLVVEVTDRVVLVENLEVVAAAVSVSAGRCCLEVAGEEPPDATADAPDRAAPSGTRRVA